MVFSEIEPSRRNRGPERIVVTGGTEGIGNQITEAFLRKSDIQIAICARTHQKIAEMKAKHPEIVALEVDLAVRTKTKGFIHYARETMGGIDTLVLNAAITGIPHQGETESGAQARTSEVFRINEVAQMQLVREALPDLREAEGGVVVFITSGIARFEQPPPGTEAYAESKRVVENHLAKLFEKPENQGVNFFSINPGPVATRMHEEIITHGPESIAAVSRTLKEKGLFADPKVVGMVIAKIIETRRNYNPANTEYDLSIERGSVVTLTREQIENETKTMIPAKMG